VLAIVVLHTIEGACTPACLLAATVPVEAVTPPNPVRVSRISRATDDGAPKPRGRNAAFMKDLYPL